MEKRRDSTLKPIPENGSEKETQHSVALAEGKVYEYSGSSGSGSGILRVYDIDTSEAATAIQFAANAINQPLDALWSVPGLSFEDMLQRPDTELERNKSQILPGGYSMIASADDGSKAQFDFTAERNHPFGYFFSSAGEGTSGVKAERRVFSVETEGVILPTRVVEVIELAPGRGYTQVTLLDLKPLQEKLSNRV